MSTRVMDCCWGLQLDPSVKAVLMSLADQANDSGVCWPGVGSLCERTCLSERTVQRSLRTLEELKLVECDVRAMKTNRYTLDVPKLKQLERDREALRGEGAGMRQGSLELGLAAHPATVAPRHGGTSDPATVAGEGATVAPLPRHGGTQTVIEPIHTPHTPQASPGGPRALDESPEQPGLMPLHAWLERVQAHGQDAIPKADDVWDYAGAVGLPPDFVALCWREFKRRQLKAGKRERDWRDKFRECVRGSWYGLWLLAPGQDARLSTAGEQAARYFDALDNEEQGGEA